MTVRSARLNSSGALKAYPVNIVGIVEQCVQRICRIELWSTVVLKSFLV